MKLMLTCLFLYGCFSSVWAQDQTFTTLEKMATLKACSTVTDYKEHLTCEGEWMQKFMDKNLRRPEKAPEDVTGTVYVRFTITETGKVTDAKILRGIHPAYDTEALRVVGLLPDFIPAQNQGKPVAVAYNLPVRFK